MPRRFHSFLEKGKVISRREVRGSDNRATGGKNTSNDPTPAYLEAQTAFTSTKTETESILRTSVISIPIQLPSIESPQPSPVLGRR